METTVKVVVMMMMKTSIKIDIMMMIHQKIW